MKNKVVNVRQLRQVIKESTEKNEFKPVVFGDKETEKINREAYRDIKKETDSYNGGLTSDVSKEKAKKSAEEAFKSDNKGMSDLQVQNPSKPFSDKVKAQMKGFDSAEAEKLHKNEELGNAERGDDTIVDAAEKHAKDMATGRTTASKIGLTGSKTDPKGIDAQHKTMFEKKMKRLTFKQKFISENHMLSMVPDTYKIEENRFLMRDSSGTEYLVEWKQEGPSVEKKVNMAAVNEEFSRIKQLWGYKPVENQAKNITEGNRQNFNDVLARSRELMKG